MNTKRDNKYYLVRNTTGSGGATEIAAGSIPVTSPALFTSGVDTEGAYKLFRGPEEVQAPSGSSVIELSLEDAKLIVQSELFTAGMPTVEFIGLEQEVAQTLRRSFIAAQSALPIATAEALFTALEPTSHALSAGSLNLAYFRFNNASVDPATKAAFNPLFEDFFKKFPRNLT